jgi:hypothetical protein
MTAIAKVKVAKPKCRECKRLPAPGDTLCRTHRLAVDQAQAMEGIEAHGKV